MEGSVCIEVKGLYEVQLTLFVAHPVPFKIEFENLIVILKSCALGSIEKEIRDGTPTP